MDRRLARRAGAANRSSLASLLRRFGQFGAAAGQEIEHGHSYRHAVGHLIEDHAEGTVGDVRIDFDAAVHRSRVEDEHVALGSLQALARYAEYPVVLAKRRDITRGHALEL